MPLPPLRVDARPGHAAVPRLRKRIPAPPPEPQEVRSLFAAVASLAPVPGSAVFVAASVALRKRKRLHAAADDLLIRDLQAGRAAHMQPAPTDDARDRFTVASQVSWTRNIIHGILPCAWMYSQQDGGLKPKEMHVRIRFLLSDALRLLGWICPRMNCVAQ